MKIKELLKSKKYLYPIARRIYYILYTYFSYAYCIHISEMIEIRIKYYKLNKINKLVPLRQLMALDRLLKLSKIYEPYGVKFFLIGGTLLGAIRQQANAGRSTDIDIGLIDSHFETFFNNIHLIRNNFKTNIPIVNIDKKKLKIEDPDFKIIQPLVRRWVMDDDNSFYKFGEDRIQFRLGHPSKGMVVDLAFFSLKSIDGEKYWAGENQKGPEFRNNKYIYFPENDLTNLEKCKLFNYEFYSPHDPERYLEIVFGKNWRIPDKKQLFVWKKISN